ncbi:cyclase family protein, partial [bacterium]|nr:cyclase family protein [bacterium]
MSDLISLTAKISDTAALRGGILPSVKYSPINRRSVYSISTIQFSIHGVTHMDLPWLVNWEQIKKEIDKNNNIGKNYSKFLGGKSVVDDVIKKNFFDEKRTENNYLIPRKEGFDAIILNLTGKMEKIRKLLHSSESSRDYSRNPYVNIDKQKNPFIAKELFDELSITKKELVDLLEEAKTGKWKSLKDKIIIFNTGWSEKHYPLRSDINNPIFEGWHLYLTHPYLDFDATKFLIDEKVLGVAS